jgi:hypothetical protein
MRRPTRRHLLLIWLTGWLLAPAVALVAGARVGTNEARAFAPLPDTANLSGKAIAAFVTDRLALRDRAAEVRADVSYGIFRTSTSPQVRIGKGPWLYLDEELRTCAAPLDVTRTADGATLTAALGRSAGLRVLLAVAPDKSGIERSHLPDALDRDRCALRRDADLHRLLLRDAATVDLWGPLSKAPAEPRAYYQRDTHWTPVGRGIVVRAIVHALAPDASTAFALGPPMRHLGDLVRLLGLTTIETVPSVREPWPPAHPVTVTAGAGTSASTSPAGVVGGRTVLVGDSQFANAFEQLAPAFHAVTFCHWRSLLAGECRGVFSNADTVVIESVERSVAGRIASGEWSTLVLALLSRAGSGTRTGMAMARGGRIAVTLAGPGIFAIRSATRLHVTGDRHAIVFRHTATASAPALVGVSGSAVVTVSGAAGTTFTIERHRTP